VVSAAAETLPTPDLGSTTLTSHHQHTPLVHALSPSQKHQISLYISTLLEWNQKLNLTAVKEEDEVMTRHIEDSLAILPPICRSYRREDRDATMNFGSSSCAEKLRLIDVGTGAGLPGLIFAIACPEWEITLLESLNKRCLFLEHAVNLLGLSNVQILCDRAEIVGQKQEYREVFDIAVARAVAEMRVLAEYCLPFVRVGGLFVAAKGHDPKEEIRNAKKSIHLLGASISESCSVESHSPHGQRSAVICLKNRITPRKYPRQPGTPSKSPL